MKQIFRMMKPWDVVLLLLFILLSFVPLAVFAYQQSQTAGTVYTAVISVNQEVVKRVVLTGHEGKEAFVIQISDLASNTIEVDGKAIRIKAATCKDQVCVRMGWISRPGQTVVCLPHRLLIEIQAEGEQEDEIIISY